jgi:hypothetical protein
MILVELDFTEFPDWVIQLIEAGLRSCWEDVAQGSGRMTFIADGNFGRGYLFGGEYFTLSQTESGAFSLSHNQRRFESDNPDHILVAIKLLSELDKVLKIWGKSDEFAFAMEMSPTDISSKFHERILEYQESIQHYVTEIE